VRRAVRRDVAATWPAGWRAWCPTRTEPASAPASTAVAPPARPHARRPTRSGGYSADRHFSSFVGFARQAPGGVGVFIDEPKGETLRRRGAAPGLPRGDEHALKRWGAAQRADPAPSRPPPPPPRRPRSPARRPAALEELPRRAPAAGPAWRCPRWRAAGAGGAAGAEAVTWSARPPAAAGHRPVPGPATWWSAGPGAAPLGSPAERRPAGGQGSCTDIASG